MQTDLPHDCRWVALPVRGNELGSLVAIEGSSEVPFAIARVYYIFGTRPDIIRGHHAHRQLTQLAVAVSGSCTMTLDDGRTRTAVRMDDPAKGLIMGSMIWREMSDFSPDCVLLVLADAHYDEGDYIRDYAEFRALTGARTE